MPEYCPLGSLRVQSPYAKDAIYSRPAVLVVRWSKISESSAILVPAIQIKRADLLLVT